MTQTICNCECRLPEGEIASLTIVCDHEGGRIVCWLDPGLPLDAIAAFYRVRPESEKPVEQWHAFRQGHELASETHTSLASLGAVESLGGGKYIVDVRIFDGFDTTEFDSITIELLETQPGDDEKAGLLSFNAAFDDLFKKFLNRAQTQTDARTFHEQMTAEHLDHLFRAVVEIGEPTDHVEDESTDVSGFFEFIDFVTAIAYPYGDKAFERLQHFPTSPGSRHYLHYVKKYLGDERLLETILEKHPFIPREKSKT